MAVFLGMAAAAVAGYLWRCQSTVEGDSERREEERKRREAEQKLQEEIWREEKNYSGKICSFFTKLMVPLFLVVIAAGVVRFLHGPFLGLITVANLTALAATFDWKVWSILALIGVVGLLYLWWLGMDLIKITRSRKRLSELEQQRHPTIGGVNANTVVYVLSPTFNSACFVSGTTVVAVIVIGFICYTLCSIWRGLTE